MEQPRITPFCFPAVRPSLPTLWPSFAEAGSLSREPWPMRSATACTPGWALLRAGNCSTGRSRNSAGAWFGGQSRDPADSRWLPRCGNIPGSLAENWSAVFAGGSLSANCHRPQAELPHPVWASAPCFPVPFAARERHSPLYFRRSTEMRGRTAQKSLKL
jgi:hypothetical protein